MKSVETQLWELALEEERRRVEKIHEKAQAEGRKTAVTFEPAKVKKPWKWENNWKVSLHDIAPSLVLAVSQFDYGLEDTGFQDFLRRRGFLHVGGVPHSKYWECMNDPKTDHESFLAVEEFRHAQEYEGKRHRYSDAEILTRWRIFQFSRVILQGAWDAYTERRRPDTVGEVIDAP